jgi:hypothetical protein
MIARFKKLDLPSVFVEGETGSAGGKTLAELEVELEYRFRHVCQDPLQQTILTAVDGKLAGIEGLVGYAGGDDFVFMSHPDHIGVICETVIKQFDLVIPDFYDRDDRLQGYIDSVDWKGNHEQFPMMSLSIAVVTNSHRPIDHPGDVSKVASDLKKLAKAHKGSAFVKDRRGAESTEKDEAA